MSIERHSGRMHLVCDCGVGQRQTYEADEFDVMISDAKLDGWSVQKIAGEWQHGCPDCARKAPMQKQLL